jgi:DNA polymerase III subunit epsilon
MRQVVLDTETTGLQPADGHRIIEIGCIELINRKFTGNRYHQFINPEREVEEGALAVHGITNQFLQDKPVFADIAQKFMDFISDAELIIHNAPFDIGFINHELNLTKQNWKPLTKYCRVIDTLVMARQLHIGQRNNLDALCKRYSVDNSQRDLHGALMDAHLLAQVYLAMTGGQGSLFEDMQPTAVKTEKQTDVVFTTPVSRKIPVLLASEHELVEHEKQLQKMQEKGQCLWIDSAIPAN